MKIGPKMRQVVFLTQNRRSIIDIAKQVGPYGSLHYGYAIVNRCIKAGIVNVCAPLPWRKGRSIQAVQRNLTNRTE